MLIHIAVLVLGLLISHDPQAAPTKGKTYKSEKGACEVILPSDWTTDSFGATDPKKTMKVSVLHEWDAKVRKLNDTMIQGIYGATKIFENTDQRLFFESPVPAMGPNPPARKWESLVPAKPQGACQVIISLRDGASEDVARSIVMSLKSTQ